MQRQGLIRALRRGLLVSGGPLVAAALISGGTGPTAVAAVPAQPSLTLSDSAPASVLHGNHAAITLTAGNLNGPAGYNLSLREVLPQGVAYRPQSTTPAGAGEPRVFADRPSAGETTLLWPAIADLGRGDSYRLGFEVDPGVTALAAGSSFTNSAQVFVSSDPTVLPAFDASGGARPAPQTLSASASATTSISALSVTVSQPSADGRILRGVHDHQVPFSVVVANNGVTPTRAVTVDGYLPAALEYVGCGDADNGHVEYQYAQPLTGHPGAPQGCHPQLGETSALTTDANGQALPASPAYTHVRWSVGDLAPGDSQTVGFLAGVPLRENVAFGLGAPSPQSLGQLANLDNNTGATTDQSPAQTVVVDAAGTGPDGTPVTATGMTTVQPVDLRIRKSVDQPTFSPGASATETITLDTSEYAFARNVRVTDTLPRGIAPGLTQPAPAYANVPVENPDGTSSVAFALPAVAPSTSTSISLPLRDLAAYRSHGQDTTPTAAGDRFTDLLTVTSDGSLRCASPDGTCLQGAVEGIDGSTPASPLNIAGADGSVLQTGAQPTLTSTIAQRPATGTTLDCSSATYVAQVASGFVRGDTVCLRLHAVMPSTPARNATVSVTLPSDALGLVATPTPATGGAAVPASVTTTTNPGSDTISWQLGAPIAGDAPATTYAAANGTFDVTLPVRVLRDPVRADQDELANAIVKVSTASASGGITAQRSLVAVPLTQPRPALHEEIAEVGTGVVHTTFPVGSGTQRVAMRAGDPVTFRVLVGNTGGLDMTGAEVWASLPTGMTCASVIGSPSDGGVCDGAFIRWDAAHQSSLQTVAPGAQRSVTYTLRTPADLDRFGVGTSAQLRSWSSTTDTGGTNQYLPRANVDGAVTVSEATTTLVSPASEAVSVWDPALLSVAVTHDISPALGGKVAVTATITNNGVASSGLVTVIYPTTSTGTAATLPAGYSLDVAGTTAGCSIAAHLVTCTTTDSIAQNGTKAFTIALNVPADGTPITDGSGDRANVSGGGGTGGTSSPDAITPVMPTFSVSPTSATANRGDSVPMSVTISNPATQATGTINLTIMDSFTGTALAFGSGSGTGMSCVSSASPVTCTFSGSIPAGGTRTLDQSLSVLNGTTLTTASNTVGVNSADGSKPIIAATGPTTTTVAINTAHVSLSGSPATMLLDRGGDHQQYNLTVSNTGGADTGALVVSFTNSDPVNASLSAGGTGWTCTTTCSRPALGAGATDTNLHLTVTAGTPSTAVPTITVGAAVVDAAPDTGSQLTASTKVDIATADLQVRATPAPATFAKGTTGNVITETVTNDSGSPTASKAVKVVDLLPEGLHAASTASVSGGWSCATTPNQGTNSDQDSVACTTSTPIAKGGTAVFSITASVNAFGPWALTDGASLTNTPTLDAAGTPSDVDSAAGDDETADQTITVSGATLSGHVYEDKNASRGFDAGEGVNKVNGSTDLHVTLSDGAHSATLIPDANGAYSFANLPPATTYSLTTDLFCTPGCAAGHVDTAPSMGTVQTGGVSVASIPVSAGDTATHPGFDFGQLKSATVTALVFNDSCNDNGTFDSGATCTPRNPEAGINGDNVTLTRTSTPYSADSYLSVPAYSVTRPTATVGGQDGKAVFDSSTGFVYPGTYKAVADTPVDPVAVNGVTGVQMLYGRATGPTGASLDETGTVSSQKDTVTGIPVGENAAVGDGLAGNRLQLGELDPAALTVRIFDDRNNDGSYTSAACPAPLASLTPCDPTLAGTVSLAATDDYGHPFPSLTPTTNGDGTYTFSNLRPTNSGGAKVTRVSVSSVPPVGSAYLPGTPVLGSGGGDAPSTLGGTITGVPVHGGDALTGYGFAMLAPSTISGDNYTDLNDDGTRQPLEPLTIPAALELQGTELVGGQSIPLTPIACTTSCAHYDFTDLYPGTYRVVVKKPVNSIALAGTDSVGTDLFGGTTALTSGGQVVKDSKGYNDLASAATDFPGQADGDHSAITAIQLGGADHHFDNDQASGYDFAELKPNTIGGFTFYDANDNGCFEPNKLGDSCFGSAGNGETFLPGVTLTLSGKDDMGNDVAGVMAPGLLSATSLADGSYQFTQLRPGVYSVQQTPLSGYLVGKNHYGQAGLIPQFLNPTPVSGTLANINLCGSGVPAASCGATIPCATVCVGINATNFDLGEVKPVSLAGKVVLDRGALGNSPLAGISVTFTGVDDSGATIGPLTKASSQADGSFTFANADVAATQPLRPGTYALTEVGNDGFLDGTDLAGPAGNQGTLSGPDHILAIPLHSGDNPTGYQLTEKPPKADLVARSTHSGNFVAGSQGTYTLSVHNNGPSPAQGPLVLTDVLPSGMSFVSASGGAATCVAVPQVICSVPNTLPVGADAPAITLTVAVAPSTPPGTLQNTLSANSLTADPTPSNNINQKDPTTIVTVSDIGVSVDINGLFGGQGLAVYVMKVHNYGPSDEPAGATLSDHFPTGLTPAKFAGNWICGGSGQDVKCVTSSPIQAGQDRPVALIALTGQPRGTNIQNFATVTGVITDPKLANNSSGVGAVIGVTVGTAQVSGGQLPTSGVVGAPNTGAGERHWTAALLLVSLGSLLVAGAVLVPRRRPRRAG